MNATDGGSDHELRQIRLSRFGRVLALMGLGFVALNFFAVNLAGAALVQSQQRSAARGERGVRRAVAAPAWRAAIASIRPRRRALDAVRRHRGVLGDGAGHGHAREARHDRAHAVDLHAAGVRGLCAVHGAAHAGGRRADDGAAARLHLRRVPRVGSRAARSARGALAQGPGGRHGATRRRWSPPSCGRSSWPWRPAFRRRSMACARR